MALPSRMARELQILEREPPPGITAWPVNDSIRDLQASIQGPCDTVYEKGVFLLSIAIPDRYPMEPPKVQFITRIYHPNIDAQGRICLDLLNMPPKGAWSPAQNIRTLLISLQSLMADPNPDDGLVHEVTHEFKHQRETFNQKARQHTQLYAAARPPAQVHTLSEPTTQPIQLQENTDPVNASATSVAAAIICGDSSADKLNSAAMHPAVPQLTNLQSSGQHPATSTAPNCSMGASCLQPNPDQSVSSINLSGCVSAYHGRAWPCNTDTTTSIQGFSESTQAPTDTALDASCQTVTASLQVNFTSSVPHGVSTRQQDTKGMPSHDRDTVHIASVLVLPSANEPLQSLTNTTSNVAASTQAGEAPAVQALATSIPGSSKLSLAAKRPAGGLSLSLKRPKNS